MDCTVPGTNIKVLSRAIYALSRIGEELCLEASKDCLILKSVNITMTAYCTFNFYSIFFSAYELDSDADNNLICKVSMRAILGVFKSYTHKNKKPEFCVIKFGHSANEIVFKFHYKHNVVVVRSLYLIDDRTVNVVYKKESAKNQVSAMAQVFVQTLLNFHMSDDDMGIEVSPTKAVLRNHIIGETSNSKNIRSQLTLIAGQFSNFNITQETCINFSLKPFRAMVQFAETFGLNISLYFESPGRPAMVEIKDNTFEANFIVATLRNGGESQSTALSSTVSLNPNNRENHNITIQDRQALESEAWDNDFIVQPRNSQVKNNKGNENSDTESIVDTSPESSQAKRMKIIFGRCFEPTFCQNTADLGEVLALDSDPDTD